MGPGIVILMAGAFKSRVLLVGSVSSSAKLAVKIGFFPYFSRWCGGAAGSKGQDVSIEGPLKESVSG